MTLQSTDKLLTLLRSHGVNHFKTPEIEVVLGSLPPPSALMAVGSPSQTKAPPAQAAPPVENTIPHHVNEVKRVLNLGHEELVDILFPEPTPPKAE
jgi:hypothetical protein